MGVFAECQCRNALAMSIPRDESATAGQGRG